MSNRLCNRCILEGIKAQAAKTGAIVIAIPKPIDGLAPEGVDIFIDYNNGEEPVWTAWFMKAPGRCAC